MREGWDGFFFGGIEELWGGGVGVLRGVGGSNLIAKPVKACCAPQHAEESGPCREGTRLGPEGSDGQRPCWEQPGNQQKGSG